MFRQGGRQGAGQENAETALRAAMSSALGLEPVAGAVSAGSLSSAYPISELAVAAIATFADALHGLVAMIGRPPAVFVDRALACEWFRGALRPVGWALPSPWEPLAGDYRAADGWIRLHTNAPKHRAAALRVVGTDPDRAAVAAVVRSAAADDLEGRIVAAGGCAAAMRRPEEWAVHAQGAAVAGEPLVDVERTDAWPGETHWRPSKTRPLAGLRVLDLTRVLAGPVATRALAAFGATVLRIDPPDWDEPAVVPEMTLGKHPARLDARSVDGRDRLHELLSTADVLVHGYRDGALEHLGLGPIERAHVRPGLVDVSLTAYGHTGPWASRRGFDSLVQMSSGIAERGMREAGADAPVPLPVQGLDHATGWLMAASVVRGLASRIRDEHGFTARLSLARTAVELERVRSLTAGRSVAGVSEPPMPVDTPWGPAELLAPPFALLPGPAFRFDRGPSPLGSALPGWP